MRDSTSANDIPVDTPIVAGYVDGAFRWSNSDWQRFARAKKVRIASSAATDDGHVLDVEAGDATPFQAPQWAAKRRLKGVDPTCYVNRANYTAVRGQFIAQHIAEPWYWLATLDNTEPWFNRVCAIQVRGENLTGHHYDESVVLDNWPTIDKGDDDIMQFVVNTAGRGNYVTDWIVKRWLKGPDDELILRKLNPNIPPTETLDKAHFDNIITIGPED